MRVLGIDPGKMTGWAIWGDYGLEASSQLPRLHAAQEVLRLAAGMHAVFIEDTFIGPGARAAIHVARTTGWMELAVLLGGGGEPTLVKASSWRKGCGIKQRPRKEAEADALAFARVHNPRLLARDIHEAEAICIASYGYEVVNER